MKNIFTSVLVCFGLAAGVFVLIRFALVRNTENSQYDERQTAGRGKAYRLAFFSLMIYSLLYACLDAGGIRWCAPGVGPVAGIFVGITVFAVTAIGSDALVGLRTSRKSAVMLWSIVILVQAVCFTTDCAKGKLIENGLLTVTFISLICVVSFLIILAAYLVHNRRTQLPEEDE